MHMTIEEMVERRNKLYEEGEALKTEMEEVPTPTPEQRTKLRALAEEYSSISQEIDEAAKDSEQFAMLRQAKEDGEAKLRNVRDANRPNLYGTPAPKDEEPQPLTLGEAFVRSDVYRNLMEMYPGERKLPPTFQTPSVRAALTFGQDPTAKMRTLITSSDSSAGDLVRPLYRGLLEPGLWADRGLTNLVTRIPVTTDTIEYTYEVSHERAADWVDEATAATGTSGTKPEGGLVFNVATDSVYTMAAWTPATKRILSDASGLAAYINAYLENDLRDKLEDELLNGDGSPTGIMNAGIQTEAAGDGPFYALRAAKVKLATIGRVRATAIVANPTNVAEWDLAEINSETNHFVAAPNAPFSGGTQRIWGVPVVESEFIDEGHALIGDFRFAVLFDREDVNISVGTINDDFVRNIVRVLAEGRWGIGVIRPNAFVDVTV